MFDLGQILTLGSSQLWLAKVSSMNLSDLSQNRPTFRNMNHYKRSKTRLKVFQATLVILRWQFKFDLPQVKWELIYSVIVFVYKLPHKLPNN